MMQRLMDSPYRLLAGVLLLTLACLIMIDPAFAQATSSLTATSGASFSCSDGHAVGSLYDSSINCPATLKASNIFSFLICNMERLAGNVLGEMYCGIIVELIPAVIAMLTLATLFFGMGFTIGVIPATARDFQLFLIKVVFVFVFATQSDYLIGTGYNLLVGGLREGVAIGLSVMFPPAAGAAPASGLAVYSHLDNFLGTAMHYATDYIGADWDSKTANPCQNALFAVMALMAVAFPPIFMVSLLIMFRIAVTFLRAIFGYLYSIVGIVFLLTLSPFFLSFYLFKQTRPFFDKWIGYLVSFSLQMVILFTFLAFVLSINVNHIAGSLTDLIMPAKETVETSTMRAPWKYCTLCEFEVIDKKTQQPLTNDKYGTMITDGSLRCTTPRTPIKALTAAAPNKDIQGALIKFTGTVLLSLLILAYLVEYILNYVPALSSFLAGGMGASYAPQLGGGTVIGQKISMDMPGGGLVDTVEHGFTSGYLGNIQEKGIAANTFSAGAAGFKKAGQDLLFGGNKRSDGEGDEGLVDSFTTFILNPHRDPSNH